VVAKSQGISQVSLRFTYIHFDLGWIRSISPEKVIYKATTNGVKAWIITEGATGNKQTYIFRLVANQEVWVSLHENIVYVPAVPHTRQPGDTAPITAAAKTR
jgi:hypothetical protein